MAEIKNRAEMVEVMARVAALVPVKGTPLDIIDILGSGGAEVPEATLSHMARYVLDALERAGLAIVPVQPTAQMIAGTLPLVADLTDAPTKVLAKEALSLIPADQQGPDKSQFQALTVACDLIRDYRTMISASPFQHREG